VAGVLTAEEQAEFESFLDAHPANRQRLNDRIAKEDFKLEYAIWKQAERLEAESWSAISGHFMKVRNKRTRIRRMQQVWAIAAIFLLAVAAFWLWYGLDGKVKETAGLSKRDFKPGRNMATLVLSDGKRLVLDSFGNEKLAVEGRIEIKKDGGLLNYTKTGKAHEVQRALTYNTLSTPKSGMYAVVLPDQTKVWLNCASSLKYPTTFEGQSSRTVELSGEGFFEVKKDPARPFKVVANGVNVDVLGTSFDVNAYPDESVIRTTLVDGAVNVSAGQNQVQLKPGEQASTSSLTTGGVQVSTVNIDKFISWKSGYFFFQNDNIQSIMRQLSRWYDVKIAYEGKVTQERFTGTVLMNTNATEVLKILELGGVHFRLENDQIVVLP
jgi:transmembrane sensor